MTLTEEQHTRLMQALAATDPLYDAHERMLSVPLDRHLCHTTLTDGMVHDTRASLQYAVALFDSAESWRIERACAVVRRALELQDRSADSSTRGMWPWCSEEPLASAPRRSWSWADFCGIELVQIALDHHATLPLDLARGVDDAIRLAAESTQARSSSADDESIAIMGTYVQLVAAERYSLPGLWDHAYARLTGIFERTLDQCGTLTAGNSPPCTLMALEEIGRMYRDVQNPEARLLAQGLHRVLWEEIALHFHPPSRQWAGPHGRSLHSLIETDTLSLLWRGLNGRVRWSREASDPAINEHRLWLMCPTDLPHLFDVLDQPRTIVRTYTRGAPSVVGTTHLAPDFALGSLNVGSLCNQRRPLLAHWGSPGAASYFRVRMLRDGHDLAAALLYCVQREGSVLGAVNLAVDGGQRCIRPGVWFAGAGFRARDLRVRFEIGGASGQCVQSAPADLSSPVVLNTGSVALGLSVSVARFGEYLARWEAGRSVEEGTSWLDVVLYSGDEREFRLGERAEAAVGFAVRIGGSGTPLVDAQTVDGRLAMSWQGLSLSIPTRPAVASELTAAFEEVRSAEWGVRS
jgi:hypothetical protein